MYHNIQMLPSCKIEVRKPPLVKIQLSCESGILIYCILKSNLLLGEFSNNPATMILVCFVAGYSEDIPLKLMDKIGAMFGGDQLKGK